jgi:iron complex transport system permease protein
MLGLAAVALAVAVGLGASRGSVDIPPGTLLAMLARRTLGERMAASWPASWETIFLQVRLPRVFLAALVGAALSMAGVVYQGLFHNPLADPYLVGVSSGAGLGATLATYLGVQLRWAGLGAVPVFAFVGALGATVVIYSLAQVGGKTPVTTLLLAGVAVAALLSAVTTYIWLAAASHFQTMSVLAWLMGSLSLANWNKVLLLLPYVAVGGLIVFGGAHTLNVLQLDEDQAHLLGLSVERSKLILVAANALLTAAAVAVSGIIGFVGLIVPHAVRLAWGPDHRFLLPMSALVGGVFMIAADGVARTVLAPVEVPVGVVTAICGVPFFLFLLRRKKQLVF